MIRKCLGTTLYEPKYRKTNKYKEIIEKQLFYNLVIGSLFCWTEL